MVVPKKAKKFGGSSSHQKAIMRNLAISLFENRRVVTTLPKAKLLRSLVDKLINIAKDDNLANRRNCIKLLGNTDAVRKLFNEVAPGMLTKSSGSGSSPSTSRHNSIASRTRARSSSNERAWVWHPFSAGTDAT